jgi:hypothetical protein
VPSILGIKFFNYTSFEFATIYVKELIDMPSITLKVIVKESHNILNFNKNKTHTLATMCPTHKSKTQTQPIL